MDFIQGEKFISLADNNIIFYRHTHDVNYFFLKEAPSHPFILISHNSDGSVENIQSRNDSANFNIAPPNLIKWFGQNIKYKNLKIESIPIGLENSQWFQEVKKREKIINILKLPKLQNNFVYLNLNIETNISEREPIYEICKNLDYVTKEYGKNVSQLYDNYLKNIYNHPFVISAAGNGEDCHRTWETLYIGSIPIVKKTINNSFYEDLPICFIDEWEQLKDINFLKNQFFLIKNKTFNTEKLFFQYWKNKIMSEKEKLLSNNINYII
jgi:hypothetical protein